MRKILLTVTVSILSMLTIDATAMPAKKIDIDNITPVFLNKIDESIVEISQAYTGKEYSGSCSTVIRTRRASGHTLRQLSQRLNIYRLYTQNIITPSTVSYGAIVFPLASDRFLDGIRIETKDGKSIKENVASIAGKDTDIAVLAGVCG